MARWKGRNRFALPVLAAQPLRTSHLKMLHRSIFFTVLTLSGFES